MRTDFRPTGNSEIIPIRLYPVRNISPFPAYTTHLRLVATATAHFHVGETDEAEARLSDPLICPGMEVFWPVGVRSRFLSVLGNRDGAGILSIQPIVVKEAT